MTSSAGHSKTCQVHGCQRKVGDHGAKGLCSAHYKRMMRGSNLDIPLKVKGQGWDHSEGYRYHGKRAQHRKIMERHIGRKLHFNEIVHHKDGDKKNNDISNLEVMSRGDHIRLHVSGKTNEQRRFEKEKYGVCLTPDMLREAKS